jgi:hypothetical protein
MGSYSNVKRPSRFATACYKVTTRALIVAIASAFFVCTVAPICHAQIGDNTSIGGSSFSDATGHIAVNEASGAANQEANVAVESDGPATLSVSQRNSGKAISATTTGSALIQGSAFGQVSGVVQVTQAAGVGNMLANAAFVGVGETAGMNPVSLSQVSGAVAPQNDSNSSFHEQTGIAPTAFTEANGVVQVDQTAGNNNVAANELSVHFDPGTVH